MKLQVYYDPEIDVLYLARPGEEEEVIEVSPGLNVEYDAKGELLGVEILNASRMLKDILKPLQEKALAA